jgi:hypothetical protein
MDVAAELLRVAGVVLDDRVVRRVIKQHHRLPGLGLQVPHARCYTLPSAALVALVERDELGVDPAALPREVTIFSGLRTGSAAGEPGERADLVRGWRAVFHGRIHQAFDRRIALGALTQAAVRERIHRIGQTEFDEIRAVLREEDLLLPPAGDATSYVEFAALYLELRAFAPRALDRTFPTLDAAQVDAAIALDIDPEALLAASRPGCAPALAADPAADRAGDRGSGHPADRTRGPTAGSRTGAPGADGASELPEIAAVVALGPRGAAAGAARRRASRARVRGNRARAAILALQAGDRDAARGDLAALCGQLAHAVGSAAAAPDWAAALWPVAELAADQRARLAPARLLHDLQTACLVATREVLVVDVVRWAWSRRKQPIVRALPATREVRIAKHLHAAAHKLADLALRSAGERDRLAAAVRDLVQRGDDQVRGALRPKLMAALDGVGLHSRNLPEHVAENKLVDELLDRVVAAGQLSIGPLRDAISHNDLKLPDFKRYQLRAGDALLRCDAALARSLDGVYRRGERYLQWLQKISSVLFGTPLGRVLTLYAILPLLGSYTVFEGLQHMVGPIAGHLGYIEPAIATRSTILGGAAFGFAVLHVAVFRRALVAALRLLGRGLRLVMLDLPRAVLRRPLVRRALGSAPSRWAILPGIPAALVWRLIEGPWRWPIAGGVLAGVALGVNSRFGRRAQERIADAAVRGARHITGRLAPSAIRWILALFSELVEAANRGLYRVDEWLRFHTGQSRLTLVVKGAIGPLWSVVAYFLRLYINLFIEPEVNPIKHFPVVTVAAKLILPFSEPIVSAISGPATRLVGPTLGVSFAAFTIFVLPGLAGFLVWEFKENWKLYKRTRSRTLGAVSFGHHGETMVQLLAPGFHSGTIPKRFTKLRRAAWSGDELAAAKHGAALRDIEHAIATFTRRDLVAMLNEAAAFGVRDVAVGRIALGSNRVRIELLCPSLSRSPGTSRAAQLCFEYQAGWMVASIPVTGWIDQLAGDQRRILEIALAGFYKRTGVELVREQLEAVLGDGGEPPPYDITGDGLIVWPGDGYASEAIYDLRDSHPTAKLRGAAWRGELPSLAGRHAQYGRVALPWLAWTTAWEQLARGEFPAPVVPGPALLRRSTAGTGAA